MTIETHDDHKIAADAEIAIIVPLYNKFAYGRRAALSALKYTEASPLIITVDDASPYYKDQDWDAWRKDIPEDRLVFKHFEKNGGLTRSWNWGLAKARELGIKYCICTNSDILFTPGWEHGLIHHLNYGYHLVAPVSNAPGVTNKRQQRVTNFYPGYQVTDDPAYLAKVAEYLRGKFSKDIVRGGMPVNGFFMMAKTDVWWQGAFDSKHVFNPNKKMTGNEDELQGRWISRNWRTGFVPSSFVFHYRAVSRGERYKDHGWHRIDDINKPV